MSRKTYSLSAIALAVIASMSFSSAYGAVALAQVSVDAPVVADAAASGQSLDQDDRNFEIVPTDTTIETKITFVSSPITQKLSEESKSEPRVSTEAESLGDLVTMIEPGELTGQMQCLAGAVYFESRGEPLAGQLAVAQVVINRSDDARWPASYCGVVYQHAQFSFVKKGRMPRIRTSSSAWQRAKAIAQIAHEGLWKSEAGEAVYFHAHYVRPKWSYRKQRTARIDTHIFYR